MKLQINDELDVDVGAGCQMELPDYVTRLEGDSAEGESIVVAAGADPRDGKILLLTADGHIRLFDARAFHIPDGPAFPCEGGAQVFLQNVGDRWPGDADGFYVETEWLLKNSSSALKDAELCISYPHENNPTGTAQDH